VISESNWKRSLLLWILNCRFKTQLSVFPFTFSFCSEVVGEQTDMSKKVTKLATEVIHWDSLYCGMVVTKSFKFILILYGLF
jgi:hypothetical protein